MLAALDYGLGNRGRDSINYPGIAKTPLIKELFLDFKARSGYINNSNEELIITEEVTKEEEEENKVKEEENKIKKEEVNEPRSNNSSPA